MRNSQFIFVGEKQRAFCLLPPTLRLPSVLLSDTTPESFLRLYAFLLATTRFLYFGDRRSFAIGFFLVIPLPFSMHLGQSPRLQKLGASFRQGR